MPQFDNHDVRYVHQLQHSLLRDAPAFPSAQDMKGRSNQQIDDRRRVNTTFRSLNTDQQAVEMSTRWPGVGRMSFPKLVEKSSFFLDLWIKLP